MRKKNIIIVLCSFLLISFIVAWNSSSVAEYRAFRTMEKNRTDAYTDNSYDNEKLLDIRNVEGIDFYLFEADEYINNEFNSKVYTIIRCDYKFGYFRSYELFSFQYDGMYGTSISTGEHGTTILGIKETNNFNLIEIVLSNDETMLVDVTDTDLIFYFTTEQLDVSSYEVVTE